MPRVEEGGHLAHVPSSAGRGLPGSPAKASLTLFGNRNRHPPEGQREAGRTVSPALTC